MKNLKNPMFWFMAAMFAIIIDWGLSLVYITYFWHP